MRIVEKFSGVHVLCVGDVMVDHFVHGAIERISPESPVPVLRTGSSQTYPGGAANVARNIAALGGRCTLISVVGDDAAASILRADIGAISGVRAEFVTDRQRCTIEKKRFVAQSQQVLRVDTEDTAPISDDDAERLLTLVAAAMGQHDVLVLSDYAKGVLTDAVIAKAIALARNKGIKIVVDPKSPTLSRYRGASIITPNAREIAAATGIDPSDDDAAAKAAAQAAAQAGVEAVLLTRAEKGMTLAQGGKPASHIRSDVREVFDVAGAGDTVVATLALMLGAGADTESAARVSNVAAGIAVGRRGTSTISQSDLLEALTRRAEHSAVNILNLSELKRRVEMWKRDGLAVGFTNGCFDILHVGHIRLMEFARANCDRLIVATNSDASVRRLKGEGRPINGEADRAEVLAALNTVDAVTVFDLDTPKALIDALVPDVLIKGADYEIGEIVGADTVTKNGGKVLRFTLVEGKSSSKVMEKASQSLGKMKAV
ncbi:MAG TPA: D-glycero-beta-D-manno-heptose-7-phosphate kinase [Rhizomicrobium sp.]|nr:D-glycero-beta-D-manno-heptose-7-phosphate kinase [Rhizomicrobium sp.]